MWPSLFRPSPSVVRALTIADAPSLAAIHRENVSTEYKSPAFWWFHHRHRLWFQVKNHGLFGILFRVFPAELKWYCSPQSRGLRKFMLKIYYYTLRRFIARRILRLKPKPFQGQ
jgi:GT2 family glycosyltransferase